jgi:hypothetical protein
MATALSGVSAFTSAVSTRLSPFRSCPSRRKVWMVTPWLVAPPGSSGSFTYPPSRRTISAAMLSTECMPGLLTILVENRRRLARNG